MMQNCTEERHEILILAQRNATAVQEDACECCGWIAGISDGFRTTGGRPKPGSFSRHPRGFSSERQGQSSRRKADAASPLRAVGSGLGERVIDVFVVPPVHLCPLSLKARNRHG
jgi:hypothetical protein